MWIAAASASVISVCCTFTTPARRGRDAGAACNYAGTASRSRPTQLANACKPEVILKLALMGRSPAYTLKKDSRFHGRLSFVSGEDYCYFGCCWSAVGAGVLLVDASCSRLFFKRLISTRPPVMRFGFGAVSVPEEAATGTGALPMPTR